MHAFLLESTWSACVAQHSNSRQSNQIQMGWVSEWKIEWVITEQMGKLWSSDRSTWQEAEKCFLVLTYQSLGAVLILLCSASLHVQRRWSEFVSLECSQFLEGKCFFFYSDSTAALLREPGEHLWDSKPKLFRPCGQRKFCSSDHPVNHSSPLCWPGWSPRDRPSPTSGPPTDTGINTDKTFPSHYLTTLTWVAEVLRSMRLI